MFIATLEVCAGLFCAWIIFSLFIALLSGQIVEYMTALLQLVGIFLVIPGIAIWGVAILYVAYFK